LIPFAGLFSLTNVVIASFSCVASLLLYAIEPEWSGKIPMLTGKSRSPKQVISYCLFSAKAVKAFFHFLQVNLCYLIGNTDIKKNLFGMGFRRLFIAVFLLSNRLARRKGR
jgi:hypothetical protein